MYYIGRDKREGEAILRKMRTEGHAWVTVKIPAWGGGKSQFERIRIEPFSEGEAWDAEGERDVVYVNLGRRRLMLGTTYAKGTSCGVYSGTSGVVYPKDKQVVGKVVARHPIKRVGVASQKQPGRYRP